MIISQWNIHHIYVLCAFALTNNASESSGCRQSTAPVSICTNGLTFESGNNILVTIPNIFLEEETTASLKSFQTVTIYRSLSLKNKYTGVTTSRSPAHFTNMD